MKKPNIFIFLKWCLLAFGILISTVTVGFSDKILDHKRTFSDWKVYSDGKSCFASSDSRYKGKRITLYRQKLKEDKNDIFFSVYSNNTKFPLSSYFSMEVGKKRYQFYSGTSKDELLWNVQSNTKSLDQAFAKASFASFLAREKTARFLN